MQDSLPTKRNRKSRVLVIGGGALGSMLAGCLSAVAEVAVMYRGRGAADHVARRGIRLREHGRCRTARVEAGEAAFFRGRSFDVVIVATKIMEAPSACKSLGGKVRAGEVLFLQNGLVDVSWAGDLFPGARIERGIITAACRMVLPGEVEVYHRGMIVAGSVTASSRPARVVDLFRRAGFSGRTVADPRRAEWAKLIFNASMNLVPVITGRGYDILKTDRVIYALVRRAFIEGKAVASRRRIRLAFDPIRILRKIRAGLYGPLAHRGSTYEDLVRGRPSELPYLTEALIKAGKQSQVATPALAELYRRAVERIA